MQRADVIVNEEQLQPNVEKIFASDVSKSQKMKQLFDLGLDIKVIAEVMDVRYNFVYNVISNYVNIHDIPTSKTTGESKKSAIIEAFLGGKTNKEIAKELKLNYNYIYKVIREFGEQSAAAARVLVNEVKEANIAPEEPPIEETKIEPEEPMIEPEIEPIEEIAPDDPVITEQAATIEEVEEEEKVEEEEEEEEEFIPREEPPVSSRPPVEQKLWKSAQPDTRAGISAFFARRAKSRE